MQVPTGQTVIENVLSLDMDNNPVSATTFSIITIQEGVENSGITVNMSLVDGSIGLFAASWSAATTGDVQIYIKNELTNVVFMSNTVSVLPDSEFQQNIYIGM